MKEALWKAWNTALFIVWLLSIMAMDSPSPIPAVVFVVILLYFFILSTIGGWG